MNINDRQKSRLNIKEEIKCLSLISEVMGEPISDAYTVLRDPLVPKKLEINVSEYSTYEEYYDD